MLRDRIRIIVTVLFVLAIPATVIYAVVVTAEDVMTPSTNDIFGDSMDLFMLAVMIPVVIVEWDCCVCVRYFLTDKRDKVLHRTVINGIISIFYTAILIYALADVGAMLGSLLVYSIFWFPLWLILRLIYIGL